MAVFQPAPFRRNRDSSGNNSTFYTIKSETILGQIVSETGEQWISSLWFSAHSQKELENNNDDNNTIYWTISSVKKLLLWNF